MSIWFQVLGAFQISSILGQAQRRSLRGVWEHSGIIIHEKLFLSFFDAMGKLVAQLNLATGNVVEIDLASHPVGLYSVVIEERNGRQTRWIVAKEE